MTNPLFDPASCRIQCISAPADKMRLYAEVVYDPIANPTALAATVEAAAIFNDDLLLSFNEGMEAFLTAAKGGADA